MFDYKSFLKTVPNRPGSYRMYGDAETVIYVGKARDLKKRLSQYFLKDVSPKTAALVKHIHHIEFTVTFSEAEALILENNLIKKYQPRYNILLRDDKSYPYLYLSKHEHPGLYFYRGLRKLPGEYFGPYPDIKAAKESLKLLQGLFPIRQCADNVYAHRSRPCLLAQIGKCLAPCVAMTDEQERNYRVQVDYVRLFLKGKNKEVLARLAEKMEALALDLRFEEAALVRDQFQALRRVQESQSVAGDLMIDMDVVALASTAAIACVHVLFIRRGRIIGTRSYFPKIENNDSEDEILEAFITQFYLNESHASMIPSEIILDRDLDNKESLKEGIRLFSKREVKLLVEVRSERARYLRLAVENAQASLKARLADKTTAYERITSLEQLLGLKGIEHMECYDISHTQGELTVASCVSFNREGPDLARYRRFNISGITPGDDFAAMHQVLERRFKDPDHGEIPDLIFIDGGRGQLKQAEEVIAASFRASQKRAPFIVAVAKGEGRKEGLETLILGYSHEEFHLSLADKALQLVLHIRDESHRFAISGHRARRSKARTHSLLQEIKGVGPKRRQALLKHFGGMREILSAGVDDLAKVPSISQDLAEIIYDSLHEL